MTTTKTADIIAQLFATSSMRMPSHVNVVAVIDGIRNDNRRAVFNAMMDNDPIDDGEWSARGAMLRVVEHYTGVIDNALNNAGMTLDHIALLTVYRNDAMDVITNVNPDHPTDDETINDAHAWLAFVGHFNM